MRKQSSDPTELSEIGQRRRAEVHPARAGGRGADATTIRDAYAFAIAFDPAAQEVIALGKFLAHTVRQQRINASQCALDVYTLAKRLATRKDGAEFKPFVEDMREKLGKKAARKTNSDPVPAPASIPPAPPRKV